ncbi:hypothetical protein F511_38012 [Dorcoceras hygrometricum]|uniref:Uncharacterized protein n=1 Tax=Dorcoceras hygrometricum TaxID=472368 RepID=A0A2Z7D1D9_9LAMI|nr:hypothetical protein F511_38012 [Dorcoceras hygrometricum]
MQHAIIDAMKCMRAIKGRIARPVKQLAIHLSRASIPLTVYQPGKSSVRDLQSPSAHHSSVVFRHNQSVDHHSDDSVGLFRHNSSVGQSQRGSQIRNISTDFSTSITAMFTLKAAKSAQFVPPTADFYLNRYNKARKFQPAPTSFHLDPSTTAEAILNLKSRSLARNQYDVASTNINDGVLHPLQELAVNNRHKALNQNAAFQLIKTTSRCSHDWFLKPAAGHSAGTIPHNATADSAITDFLILALRLFLRNDSVLLLRHQQLITDFINSRNC